MATKSSSTASSLPTYDFFKISTEDIYAFMSANATQEERKAFVAKAFTTKQEYHLEPETVPGTNDPIVISKVDSKTGEIKWKQKMRRVPNEGAEEKRRYNHRRAVTWFVETYNGKKINVPNAPKKKTKKPTAEELFADFF